MQEFAKFVSITRIPGSSHLKQGVKGGRTPRNAVRGGNGSFIVAERAKVLLTLNYKEQNYQKDIYYDIKDVTSKRITDNLCLKLEAAFENFDFTVENGRFTNISEAIESAAL